MKLKEEIIHQTKNGYVLKCNCCANIQVGFGNMLLVNNHKEFLVLKQCIEELNTSGEYKKFPNNKQYVVTRVHLNSRYAFTKDEIMELRELLGTADGIMNVLNMAQNIFLNRI